MNLIKSAVKSALLLVIKAYQFFVSPLLPSACRFYPSCSTYTYQAVEKYGPFKGVYLGVGRILKCHPFHPGGHDPVP